MRISFDLDETLFVSPLTHEVEPELKWPYKKIYRERLRLGTVRLIRELQERGYEVWIYTSSYRRVQYLKNLFALYNVNFQRIINETIHEQQVQFQRTKKLPSKMPSFYRISLHIDDEQHVKEQGKMYGFHVFLVNEPDPEWVDKVLAEADRVAQFEKEHGSGCTI